MVPEAMEAAGDGIGQRRIHVIHRPGRDGNALAQAVVEGSAVQAPQHQISRTHVKALGEGAMGSDAAVHLSLLLQTWAVWAVDLHHQVRVVGMVQHRGVIAAAQDAPGARKAHNPHRIMGIGAVDADLRQQLVVNVVQQLRESGTAPAWAIDLKRG